MSEDADTNGENKKPRTLYSDAQKAEMVKGYDAASSKAEYKLKHGIQSGQIIRWRSQLALQDAGHEEPPPRKPGRKPRAPRPAAAVISARDVAAYITALESRVAALEGFELRLSKFLGGK